MKKTYMTPDTQVIKIAIDQHLLTGSPDGNSMVNPKEPPQAPGGFDSRQGRGFWDDEEDF